MPEDPNRMPNHQRRPALGQPVHAERIGPAALVLTEDLFLRGISS